MNRERRPLLDAPANTALLAFLATRDDGREATSVVRWPDEVQQPYLSLGCHPDVVERIWRTLNGDLPKDCRAVVCRTPVLLPPDTGVIFAIGLGTSYAFRLPPPQSLAATERSLKPVQVYAQGREIDLRPFGDGWLFGRWLQEEATWCQAAFEAVGQVST